MCCAILFLWKPGNMLKTEPNMCMDVSHSVYLICYKVIFSKTELNFDLEDKPLPVSNMASSGLKKMLDFIILYIIY